MSTPPSPLPADTHDLDRESLRDGEAVAKLPEHFDAGLYFIGSIRTPWTTRGECPKNARGSDAVCTIVVDERWREALRGLETCSHVIVLYWMHEARRDLVLQSPRHYGTPRGTFSIRSPVRPNPIALSVAQLVSIEGGVVKVRGIDCLDGTPLVDLKPYFASVDAKPDATVGWHRDRG
ncbi:MAG: tRNA (N6-threonylcarbamoyladenosine(37)-N6)-methyltransferase TrmO [Rhizobiales bacterium]|nr:tRNA (N6-threonylcarbamoyladenosine(37)-N6)-methyltransferase TrmO [Hyphomicrobiales bacterium]